MNVDTTNVPQPIIDFLNCHLDKQISYEEFVKGHTNQRKVHNHTIENLFLYFDLEKQMSKNRVAFYPTGVFIVDNRKYKFFTSDNENFISSFDWSMIPEELYKKCIIYSSVVQNLEGVRGGKFIGSELRELNYNLEEIFGDPEYKAFYKKYDEQAKLKAKKTKTEYQPVPRSKVKKRIDEYITRPLKRVQKYFEEGLVYKDFEESDLEDMELVHKRWVEHKQNDPTVFQMMFSSGRYNKCAQKMYNSKFLKREDYYSKIIYYQGQPVAVIQCLLQKDKKDAYGQSYFSCFWDLPHGFVFDFFSYYFRDLYENYGIKFMSYGMEMDKKLLVFKNHFPSSFKTTMKYNFQKPVEVKRVETIIK